jgi:hypothetical protein
MKLVNNEDLSVSTLTDKMREKQPLPIGRTQFMEWSDRIIQGAMVEAETDSLRFSLAAMLMHLGPTEAMREDGYFILSLRKAAVNQTAHAIMTELKEAQEAKKKLAEDTAPKLGVVDDGGILAEKGV